MVDDFLVLSEAEFHGRVACIGVVWELMSTLMIEDCTRFPHFIYLEGPLAHNLVLQAMHWDVALDACEGNQQDQKHCVLGSEFRHSSTEAFILSLCGEKLGDRF